MRNSKGVEVPDLYSALHALLSQIPRGRVTTYGDLAEALGTVKAARWVATYLLNARLPAALPAHRVVSRQGELAVRRDSRHHAMAERLAREAVPVRQYAVELDRFRFREFDSARPLSRLLDEQHELAERVRLQPLPKKVQLAAGVDVSYAGSAAAGPVPGTAAYTLFDLSTGELVDSLTVTRNVDFPYIPGLLSFRELPILLELLQQVREQGRLADVILVDGNGILHHRHAGIASHLGVLASVPTIGIGKSLLCGKVDLKGIQRGDARPVHLDQRCVAQALQTAERGAPIFVSPGHLVDLPSAVPLVQKLAQAQRLPAPIAAAHRLSRKVAATM